VPSSEPRSPEEVLHDHLRLRAAKDFETDLATNYADDVVVIDRYEVRHGTDGVRDAVDKLRKVLPGAHYEYVTTHLAGDIGYLEWRAQADGASVEYGADTFLIRDGLIRAQTLYYRVLAEDE
jgi:ketosteroid isomerase-like protein